jgi:predicted metal-dependent hydrolase
MKKQVILGGRIIEYEIIYSKRKSIGLEINTAGELKVRAPYHTLSFYIEKILQQKSHWIIIKLNEMEIARGERKVRSFENGCMVPYCGADYELEISRMKDKKQPFISLSGNKIVMHLEDVSPNYVRQVLEVWYKEEAKKIMSQKTQLYAKKLGVVYTKIKINNPAKRWGSCSSKGNINYNWRIVMAPESIIDYLVVHELSHLREMNHSAAFYQLVASVLPLYKDAMVWLKENGKFLEL